MRFTASAEREGGRQVFLYIIFSLPEEHSYQRRENGYLPALGHFVHLSHPHPLPSCPPPPQPPAFLPHPCSVAVLLQGTGPKASAGCQLDLSAWEAHCYPPPAPLNTHTRTQTHTHTHTLMPMALGTSGFVFCHHEGSFHTSQRALAA